MFIRTTKPNLDVFGVALIALIMLAISASPARAQDETDKHVYTYTFGDATGDLQFEQRLAPMLDGMSGDRSNHLLSRGAFSVEILRMEQEARRLASEIRRSDDDTSELEAELDELLDRIFDKKLESREERIRNLEAKLVAMRDRVSQRRNDHAEIIQQRKDELLGRGSRYEW